jgi:micrococcal nuclease
VTTPLEPKAPKAPERTGCDPAYPEERTCIPPGPPFDQGCAVTSKRRFQVLPPDPQRLDHNGDGIGCEPIGAST